jgi:hypothetical protein
MNDSKNFFIFLGIAVFIFALTMAFYKFEEVPKLDWKKNFNFNSKEVYGLWAFKEILIKHYGNENVHVERMPILNQKDSNIVLIIVDDEVKFSENDSLSEWVAKGNMLYVISYRFTISTNGFYSESDSIISLDSMTFYKLDNGQDSFLFKNYFENLYKAQKYTTASTISYKIASQDNETIFIPLVSKNDTTHLCSQLFYKNGSIIIHSIPAMFFNISSKQPFYAKHFEATLGGLESKKIILTNHYNKDTNNDSPLKLILKHKPLAAAYYTMLCLVSIILLFSTKSKMKAIPLKNEVTNTSIEYVSTLARLYQTQNDHMPIVKRIEDNFYFTVWKQYYLRNNDRDFVTNLAKRAGVNEQLIMSIQSMFKKISENNHCTLHDLNTLYNYIITFEKKSKNGKSE